MTKLVNRAKMTTATTGTETITLGSAVDGYQTFAAAGVADADVVRYTIEDGDAWEIGSGTYSAGTLTRVLDESSTGSLLNLSGEAVVYVTAAGEDIQQPPSEGPFVDGDKTKLDGIEAGATADQTASEILTAIKTVDGAASGLDADLLDGQHGSYYYPASNPNGYTSNVGDITGVSAGSGLTGGGTSGTVTVSHADTSTQGSVNNSGRTFIQDITLDTYGHVTGITSATDSDTYTGTVTSVAATVPTGFSVSGSPITTSGTLSISYDTGYQGYTAAEASKLAGIETGATADQTASEILTAIKTVDGAASGLDADLLDGQHGSYYLDGNNFINLPAGYTGWTVSDGTNSENIADGNTVTFSGSGSASVSYNTTTNTLTVSATDTNTTYSAGTALDLSGTTFNVDLSELATSTTDGDGDYFVVVDTANAQRKLTKGNINISGFNNDAGYTTNVGDITAVNAGSGITGGGTTGSVTISHADTSSQSSVNNSGATVIQDVTLDTYGHVTGLASATLTASTIGALASTNPVISAGTITEDVYAISGTSVSLEPDNGSIQTHTLTGNTTYTDGFSAGQAITLMIDDGTDYTITWPTMTWVNNGAAAPTLATSGYTVVALWKVSTTLYGALVGDGS